MVGEKYMVKIFLGYIMKSLILILMLFSQIKKCGKKILLQEMN